MSGFGTDLRVILGPPGMIAHDTSPLDVRPRARVARTGAAGIDLATTEGRENLAQAIMLRLLTPVGAMRDLGHAGYGSRLGELIGRRKTDGNRALCKTYVLEAIASEARVEPTAVSFDFDIASEGPSDIRFTLGVRPTGTDDVVLIDLAVGL